ncbi:unnamed protein product [Spirodela intermedia]|uniref:CBF1-interacting co-repressor CIR N-terminal domain-containing protein n=1 Tax=Spirodela intermedia TaxID=51605 RepID=A0A7I8KD20_SPIIN|nr:unnamed protein product [Spirodela intermedia]
MEDDGEPGGPRLSKRFAGGKLGGGEVDYKTKAGTAWSHSYLNQKPWHPLSYPNQRRKWIAEQSHAQRERHAEEVSQEFAQEQEFFRQTALLSEKEKEKIEMMKAVSFMYLRPPGYNAESAKAAEIADEQKKAEESTVLPSTGPESPAANISSEAAKRKAKPRDVFGRTLPTEEEFEVLKNAPRLETGVVGRVKPFAVEIRNVRCMRCGKHGHQSGDRECPLKDAIMPSEESRLKREDPLTAIMAQTGSSEALRWELKQKPGLSPPRGGFDPDDPNQQIVAGDDIFDEYGGFLGGGGIPALLGNLNSRESERPSKRTRKHGRRRAGARGDLRGRAAVSPSSSSDDEDDDDSGSGAGGQRSKRRLRDNRRRKHSDSRGSEGDGGDRRRRRRKQTESSGGGRRRRRDSCLSESDAEVDRRKKPKKSRSRQKPKRRCSPSSGSSDSELRRQSRRK